MTKHRSHSAAFKRQVAEEFIAGETLHALSQAARHLAAADPDLGRQVRGRRPGRGRAGGRPDPGIRGQDRRSRAAGRPPGAGDRAAKGGFEACTPAEKRDHLRRHRPRGISVSRGCELMGLVALHLLRHAARSPRRRRAPRPDRRDLRRVRVLRLPPRRGGAAPSGRGGERQEAAPPDARARPAAQAAPALRRHHRQRPCRADLPDLAKDRRSRPPEPALGRGPDLRRHPGRLRLPRRDPGCLVAQGGRLRDQPVDGRPHRRRRAEGGDQEPQRRPRAAFTIPIAVRNTHRRSIASCWPPMAWSAR